MRVKMSQNKTNFKSMYKGDLSCILCKDKSTIESEIHLLNCSFLNKVPELSKQIKKIKYEDIFKDIQRQKMAVEVWTQIFKIYETEKENQLKQKQV